jgi:hypothetical protein
MDTLNKYKNELTRMAQALLESKINKTQDDWWHGWTLPNGQQIDLNVWVDEGSNKRVVTAYLVLETGDLDTKNFLRVLEHPTACSEES